MQNKPTKILHITPHLGGGVGRVILGYLSKATKDPAFRHQIACLDYANENATKTIKNLHLKLIDKMSGQKKELLQMIEKSDIILMHWWNHPLLYNFLVRETLPPCRLAMWSHTSGLNPPAIFTKKVLNYPDKFVFVTPISFQTPEVKSLTNYDRKKLQTILATSGTDYVEFIKPKKHRGFIVGYIGTVDYAKIHPNFLKICHQIKIPNVRFIVCGGSNEKELEKEAAKLGLADKIKFTGLISNINEYLSVFDVFGYPLSPKHYGACDQALVEAMTAGVTPVVFNNPMEKFMIKDGQWGIIVKNEKEYIKAIEKLYKNKKLRASLSSRAKKYAVETFSIDKTMKDWKDLFGQLLALSKTPKKWNITKKTASISSADIFIESLGKYGKNFASDLKAKRTYEKTASGQKIKKMAESINWQSPTKSTAHHYHYFFPSDKNLTRWSKLMKK